MMHHSMFLHINHWSINLWWRMKMLEDGRSCFRLKLLIAFDKIRRWKRMGEENQSVDCLSPFKVFFSFAMWNVIKTHIHTLLCCWLCFENSIRCQLKIRISVCVLFLFIWCLWDYRCWKEKKIPSFGRQVTKRRQAWCWCDGVITYHQSQILLRL